MFGLKSINKSKINLIWLDKFSVKWERNATTGQTFPHSIVIDDVCFIFLLLLFFSSSHSTDHHHHHHSFRYRSDLRNSWNLFDYFSFIVGRCSSRTHRAATDRSLTKSKRRCVFLAIWGGERRQLTKKRLKFVVLCIEKSVRGLFMASPTWCDFSRALAMIFHHLMMLFSRWNLLIFSYFSSGSSRLLRQWCWQVYLGSNKCNYHDRIKLSAAMREKGEHRLASPSLSLCTLPALLLSKV